MSEFQKLHLPLAWFLAQVFGKIRWVCTFSKTCVASNLPKKKSTGVTDIKYAVSTSQRTWAEQQVQWRIAIADDNFSDIFCSWNPSQSKSFYLNAHGHFSEKFPKLPKYILQLLWFLPTADNSSSKTSLKFNFFCSPIDIVYIFYILLKLIF